jgi:hypothetical protein
MLNRLFPEVIDNRYRGHRVGLWLFYPVIFLNAAISLVAIFKSDGGAQSADGIPLDTFGRSGAEAVIGVVAYLGLANLLLVLLGVVSLVRYRAMIPLIYLLLVADWLGHKGINVMKPIVRAGAAHGGVVSLTIFALTLAGLVLSLLGNDTSPDRGARAA